MKKKYKLKKKNFLILIIFLIVLYCVFFGNVTLAVMNLMLNDYSFNESMAIYNAGVHEKVLLKKYNKNIATIVSDKNYNDKNFDLYYEVDYLNNNNFVKNVNEFLSLGYSTKDINVINEKNDSVLNNYLLKNYVSHIDRWLKYSFFKSEYIERYLSYFDGDYKKTIVNVNIGLDKPFYEDVNVVEKYSVDVLANKYNKLSDTFVPDNLVQLDKCSSSGHYLSKDAKMAYDKMCDASLAAGLRISSNSSYRSYDDQVSIYNHYLSLYGQSYVDKYVATPGFSEHQTGLSLDVKSLDSSIFENSKEYEWMVKNSYKYGFILRYPSGKSDITGYNSEAWHFRYVGEEIARYIYENDITFDEYYVMFLDK